MRASSVCVGVAVALLLTVAALAACQAAPAAAPTALPEPAVAPTTAPPTAVPATAVPTEPAFDLAAIQVAWESGPHNNAYDLYKGPNTYCAMCHSPQNFDPKATVGKPPNCWSCKFPTDKEVRISPNSPLIPEEEWAKINCAVCHPDTKDYSQYAIWNQATGKYQPVATTTQLCQKCHTYSSGGSKHQIIVSGGAHSNQITFAGDRPALCTDCHDPHSLEASCSNSECHVDIMDPGKGIKGHDAAHANIDCVACHNSNTSLVVGIDETTKRLTTGTNAVSAGKTTFTPQFSHMFDKAADCARCHFADNPWGLSVPTPAASGKPKS